MLCFSCLYIILILLETPNFKRHFCRKSILENVPGVIIDLSLVRIAQKQLRQILFEWQHFIIHVYISGQNSML